MIRITYTRRCPITNEPTSYTRDFKFPGVAKNWYQMLLDTKASNIKLTVI